jgi:hypothetical protein
LVVRHRGFASEIRCTLLEILSRPSFVVSSIRGSVSAWHLRKAVAGFAPRD